MSEILVVKLGGTTIADQSQVLAEVAAVARRRPVVLVHGGGKRITEWLERLGVPSKFEGGLRVTDAQSLEVAAAVLRGVVNSELVAGLRDLGVDAVGLSGVDGGLLVAERIPHLGLVASVVGLRRDLLDAILVGGQVPVVAPLARDADGIVCNVNADDVAAGIAAGLGARQLVLLTDVDGVRDADGRRLDALTAGEAETLIESGVIAGGMVPKVRAALGALGWDGAEAIIADSSRTERPRARPGRPDLRHAHHRRPGGPRGRGMTMSVNGTGQSGHDLKRQRQRAIRELVASRPIGSQREVVDALSAQGFDVTQATVSRDITELGLVKAPGADGHVYVAPERVRAERAPRSRRPARADPGRHPRPDRPERPDPRADRDARHGQRHRPGDRRIQPAGAGRHAGGRQYAPRPVPRRGPPRALARALPGHPGTLRRFEGPVNKVVLAYSGGLDTSVAVAWLREQFGVEVVTLTVDLGGGSLRQGVEARAISAGASRAYVVDARERFVTDFVWPHLQANALYQGAYPLATALARPLIAQLLVEVAKREGADAVAHGCTGKGNDQVRFDVATHALDPGLEVIAPMRVGMGLTRDQEIDYAAERGIEIPITKASPYSIDVNLWGRSCETGVLEDPWVTPPPDAYEWTVAAGRRARPGRAPHRLRGRRPGRARRRAAGLGGAGRARPRARWRPRRRSDRPRRGSAGRHQEPRDLRDAGGDHPARRASGAGRADAVARHAPVQPVRGRRAGPAHLRRPVVQRPVARPAGVRRVVAAGRLGRGPGAARPRQSAVVVGRRSPMSLYDKSLATYDEGDAFDHASAVGFIEIFGLPLRVEAARHGAVGKHHGAAWTWTDPLLEDLPTLITDPEGAAV